MNDLVLSIHGTAISGSGSDIIAPFQFNGRLRDDGSVELIKKYDRKHSVLYVGQYDGEGTLSGDWDISGYRGEWSIKFVEPVGGDAFEIQEIVPEG